MGELKIKQLTKRIWYLPNSRETDRPVLAAIIGDKYTLMMDAGNSPMHSKIFLNELKKIGVQTPDFLVFTHGHWDHVLGYSLLNMPAFAHIDTKAYMRKLEELKWDDEALEKQVKTGITTPACAEYIKKEYGEERHLIQIKLPSVTFKEDLQIDLGNLTCTLKHVGGDHASDSVVLHIHEEKVLFIGDCISPCMHSPERYYRLNVISLLLNQLSSFDCDYVIHSHAEPMTKVSFQNEVQEYRDVIEAVRKYGNDLESISNEIAIKWKRELPNEERDFFQYFLNGLKL
ncbi:MAG TPA: MBL fold metallo-hydrolase [Pseudoneobacillus sp.]|nr:MBL fold metallo-hydrolase [Pseudoneobacillus sp.]